MFLKESRHCLVTNRTVHTQELESTSAAHRSHTEQLLFALLHNPLAPLQQPPHHLFKKEKRLHNLALFTHRIDPQGPRIASQSSLFVLYCLVTRRILANGQGVRPEGRRASVKRRGGEEQRSLHPADSAVPTWLSRSSAPCAAGCPSVALPDGSEGLGLLAWAGA